MEAQASQSNVKEVRPDSASDLPGMEKKETRPNVLELKERIQQLQTEAVEQLEQKLQQLVDEALLAAQIPATPPSPSNHLLYDDGKYRNRTHRPDTGGSLPEKQFLPRESVLTDLLRIKHFRTVYNIFVAMLLILFLHTAVYDLVADGQLKLGFSTIFWNFDGLHIVMAAWLCMTAAVFALFIAFCYWASIRASLPIAGSKRQFLDYFALIVMFAYMGAFLVLPVQTIQHNRLPPISAMVILCEQVRMMMKVYAFVRSNVPKVKNYKPHSDSTDTLPDFNHFLYFMFVPTLVYRDSYPRTKEIRWKVVAWHLIEVLGVIFFISFIFERSLVPVLRKFGKQPFSPKALVVAIFGSMVPSITVFLCGFYCILHAWMNAFAEITRFADRMFYKDWWNANSYATYYRNWNVIVHDWLYTYVYKDLCELLGSKRRALPMLTVFFLSAFVHEYMLTFIFGFCYPMLFMAFGVFSVGLVFVTHDRLPGGNLLMWLLVSTGTGLLTSIYMMEWFARRNCPRLIDSSWDFFVPRSWFCSSVLSE